MEFRKIKTTLITFLVLTLAGFAFFSLAQDSGKNVFLDSDQDELSDEEETAYGTDSQNSDTDGDGYRDGIEVQGGYNPLLAGPGDKIITDTSSESDNYAQQVLGESTTAEPASSADESADSEGTLTDKFSKEVEKITADMISGENGEISLDQISQTLDKILEEQKTEIVLPEISADTLTIKEQSYSHFSEEKQKEKRREDFLEYLTSISYIALNNSPESVQEPGDLNLLSNIFTGNIDNFFKTGNISQLEDFYSSGGKTYEDALKIEVPEEMVNTHLEALRIAKYMLDEKENLNINNQSDPIASIVEFSKMEAVMQKAVVISDKIQEKLDEYEITEIAI